MTLGRLLKKHRLDRSLTLEAVALEAGTDQGNLSRIERDVQQPSAALLGQIAQALGITVSGLYAELEGNRATKVREESPAYSKQMQQLQKGFLLLNPANQKLALEFVKMLRQMQKVD